MSLDQRRTPLFEALLQYRERVRAPLHVPGHKLGRGAPEAWRTFLGQNALSIDQTEAPGLDDLHAPEGVIAEAQALAAEAFGAAASFFLVGGTTAGLHAGMLTACRPGQTVAVPRHAHRSVLGALVLAGARPAWVRVRFHEELDLAIGMHGPSYAAAIMSAEAAILLHPTYFGHADRLADQIQAAHAIGLPVLVDEAHGSHFAFHPDLPPAALTLGADLVVQSLHKTGGSLTQSSLCHLNSGRLDPERLKAMLRLVQSTSPSYLLMASLDLARRELALSGQTQWDRALSLAAQSRRRIAAVPGLRVHDSDDPTKLLIDVRGRGLTGYEAAAYLWSTGGVALESSGQTYVLAVLTPGDTPESLDYLIGALNSLPRGNGTPPLPPEPPWPETVMTPREAYLGPSRPVRLAEARGRIAAELVAPYPPGIPVVAPGERLTPDVLDYLQAAVRTGGHLQGPADPNLATIRVVEE